MGIHSKYPSKAGIYKLTCINNGKVYIGKAVNINRRLNQHKNYKPDNNGYFPRAVLKYGWDCFKVEILEIVENFNKLNDNPALLERESYYIKLFDSTNIDIGYNLCKHSRDTTGIPLSKEHREKISQSNLGRIVSDETREKIKMSSIGKIFSKDHKENLSLSHKGKPISEKARQSRIGKIHSEETKNKMRMSRLGKKMSEETREKMRQINLGKRHSEETKAKMRKPRKSVIKTEIQ
jgi:group I intron endonuclease